MNLSKKSDILIIGGGVIGLALARALRKRGGGEITILERGAETGTEASYAAAGMLAPQSETNQSDEFFRFCAESLGLYRQFSAELFNETGVDIELETSGTLYLAFTEKDSEEILARFRWQKKAGLSVEHLSAEEARKTEPFVSPDVREALYFPNDWQVDNRKLMTALQKFARENEIEIFSNAEVVNLLTENGKVIGAETKTKKFYAGKIVLAAGAWTSLVKIDHSALPLVKIEPVRGQMISFKTAKRLFSKVIYSPRGYLVPRRDGRILAGATVETVGFDKSVTEEGIDFVLGNALEIAPTLANLQIFEKWAGLRPAAGDYFPVLGEFPEIKNLFVATAHYRNGILLAPKTSEILADKITGTSRSEVPEVFSPRRFAAATRGF
jgi:glycine oxidase